ncbi:MAG TPA: hypothetical protein PKZ76_15380 [Xanthomonadaceae bacterium]|nr:hypothetical protein [Xanthomonadaceae bacterium]
MKLSPSLATMLLAGLFASSGFAMTNDEYKAEKDRIETRYKSAKKQCDTLKGNAEDVCEKQAKGERKVAEAELENRYKPSESNAYKARVARADADYEVAEEKCDDRSGNDKDVCKKDAKAAHAAALENAKVSKAVATPAATRSEVVSAPSASASSAHSTAVNPTPAAQAKPNQLNTAVSGGPDKVPAPPASTPSR